MQAARRNDLLLTISLAQTLARLVAALDDPELCRHELLVELVALADRAQDALLQASP